MEKCPKQWQVKVACVLEVRLNGSTANAGFVQIYYKQKWSYICSYSWGDLQAAVACRQLGYTYGFALRMPYSTKISLSKIRHEEMKCMGNEIGLQQCQKNARPKGNCSTDLVFVQGRDRSFLVSARCEKDNYPFLRLTGLSSAAAGRVEVYYNDTWKAVCGDTFGIDRFNDVCSGLGYEAAQVRQYTPLLASGQPTVKVEGGLFRCLDYLGVLFCPYAVFEQSNCTNGTQPTVYCGKYS
jgi:hypothetical protein